MTEREALRLAMDALERSVATCFYEYAHQQVMSQPDHFINQTITAINEVLAQPEKEPVAKYSDIISDGGLDPRNTTPPQRTWVGLTDEDKQIAFDDTQEGGGFWEFADAIEAKLKEKNT